MNNKYYRWFLLFAVSSIQAYLCYLSHFYLLTFAPLDWIMTIISTPVYFLLLPVVFVLENTLEWKLTIYNNFMFPHLKLEAWFIGIIFLAPLNLLYLKVTKKIYGKFKKRT